MLPTQPRCKLEKACPGQLLCLVLSIPGHQPAAVCPPRSKLLTMLLRWAVPSWPHCLLLGHQVASRSCCCRPLVAVLLRELASLLLLLLLPLREGHLHCSAGAAAAAWTASTLPLLPQLLLPHLLLCLVLLPAALLLLPAAAALGRGRSHNASRCGWAACDSREGRRQSCHPCHPA